MVVWEVLMNIKVFGLTANVDLGKRIAHLRGQLWQKQLIEVNEAWSFKVIEWEKKRKTSFEDNCSRSPSVPDFPALRRLGTESR